MNIGGEARTPQSILSRHELKQNVERRAFIVLALSLLVLLAASVWSIYRWYFAYSRFGPAVVWRWSAPTILTSIFAMILTIYASLFLIRNRQRRIFTTQDAILFVNGGNRHALPWSGIASIQSSAARYAWSRSKHDPLLRITLSTVDSDTIKIPAYLTALNDLLRILKTRLYPLAMDRYRELMKSGHPIEFGPLQLTRTGVLHRGQTEQWQYFRDVKLESGKLKIEFNRPGGSKLISIPAQRVPNIDLCAQLLKNIEF